MTIHLNAASPATIHVSQLSTVNIGKRHLFVTGISILHNYYIRLTAFFQDNLGKPVTHSYWTPRRMDPPVQQF